MTESPLWLITVQLPGRYFNAQLATRAPTAGDAREAVENTLAALKKYIPAANLEVTEVEQA